MLQETMKLSQWFWDSDVWLPPNVTWSHLQSTEDSKYFEFADLIIPLPAALLVILVRWLFQRYISRPLGLYLGLRDSKRLKASTNPALEELSTRWSSLTSKQRETEVVRHSRELHMTERQIDRWLRRRKLQNKPNTLDKFAETGWRAFYYNSVLAYGIYILWDKPWLWDIRKCWYNYPYHYFDRGVWWYYMVELSFYWSLLASQFYDVKRKDFWEMFIHHMTTIGLMVCSWTVNLWRVGTLVLLIHDCADIFLEGAKLCKYTNYQKMCDLMFLCFAFTWIVTRLGIYPTWILYSTTIEAPQIVEMFPAYYIFNALLSTLLILHVVWTYFILKIVYKGIYTGKTERDTRSESSDMTLSTSSLDEADEAKNAPAASTTAPVVMANGGSSSASKKTE